MFPVNNLPPKIYKPEVVIVEWVEISPCLTSNKDDLKNFQEGKDAVENVAGPIASIMVSGISDTTSASIR